MRKTDLEKKKLAAPNGKNDQLSMIRSVSEIDWERIESWNAP